MMYTYIVFSEIFQVKASFLTVCNSQRIWYISTEKDEFILLKDTQFEALVRILQQNEIYEKSIQY